MANQQNIEKQIIEKQTTELQDSADLHKIYYTFMYCTTHDQGCIRKSNNGSHTDVPQYACGHCPMRQCQWECTGCVLRGVDNEIEEFIQFHSNHLYQGGYNFQYYKYATIYEKNSNDYYIESTLCESNPLFVWIKNISRTSSYDGN